MRISRFTSRHPSPDATLSTNFTLAQFQCNQRLRLTMSMKPNQGAGPMGDARRMTRDALLLTLVACSPSTRAAEPHKAEYATRWDPAQGGPRSASEVSEALGLPAATETEYDVQYYDAPPPASAPANAVTIVRERTKAGGATQILVKFRLRRPLRASWICPMSDAKRSEEVDVSFGAGGRTTRVYSYACAVKAEAPPPSLNAVPKRCALTMTRSPVGGLKIESWALPGGRSLLEVSRSATNSETELARFQAIYQRLAQAGVKPTATSKTELGSRCE